MEGRQQPVKISLGLLPSGPDPVGEHNACTNLPLAYMGERWAKSKLRCDDAGFVQLFAARGLLEAFMTKPDEAAKYILGYSAEEHARLDEQARLYQKSTEDALAAINVRPGWRCLDVGCGTGAVMRLLGERTGSTGHVHGVDLDGTYGQMAVGKLNAEGKSRYTFQTFDVANDAAPDGAPFDLVFARLLIIHMKDPIAVLKSLWACVKPGGTLLIQDMDMQTAGIFTTLPNANAVGDMIRRIFQAMGKDFRMGSLMPTLFLRSSIGPHDGILVSAAFEPVLNQLPRWVAVLKSLTPVALQHGLATQATIDDILATLEKHRLEPDALGRAPDMVATWKRKPG